MISKLAWQFTPGSKKTGSKWLPAPMVGFLSRGGIGRGATLDTPLAPPEEGSLQFLIGPLKKESKIPRFK